MRPRRCLYCFGAAILGTLFLASSAWAAELSASFTNESHFPSRALLVSVPADRLLTAKTVHVNENGAGVGRVAVTSLATANRGDFGVILVIDTSESMRGRPVSEAMLAARTLAAERRGKQELGVIEFNRSASVVLPLTSESTTITGALAQPPRVAPGTHIYDATLLAIRQLHYSGITAGTVIVLSDGADVGSNSNLRQVVAAAANDHVRVYTVGVDDPNFTPSTLKSLARATTGSYTSSSAGELGHVFTEIESQLVNHYILRYRSPQGKGRAIRVALSVDRVPGVWIGHYASPPAPVSLSPNPARRSPSTPFWASSLAIVVVAFVSALLLVAGLLVYLVPHRREHKLRHRIGQFTSGEETREAEPALRKNDLVARVDAWMARFKRWPRFKEDVEVAAMQRSAAAILMVTVIATLGLALIVGALSGIPVLGLPIFLVGPLLMTGIVRHRADAQRRLFTEQLAGHLEEIGSAMRAGHSVVASIAAMADDAIDPSRREFQRAVADEQLGIPLDSALHPVARRMRCTDIEQLSLVASLNQRTGGNMAAVLDLIADGVRERSELRRELQALTAQARLSRWIVTGLPVAVLALMAVIRPSYLRPLFTTTPGAIALVVATLLVVLGSFVMRLIVAPQE